MFNMVYTVFSCRRGFIVCWVLQESLKVKESSLHDIWNEDTAFLLRGAQGLSNISDASWPIMYVSDCSFAAYYGKISFTRKNKYIYFDFKVFGGDYFLCSFILLQFVTSNLCLTEPLLVKQLRMDLDDFWSEPPYDVYFGTNV